MVFVRRGSCKEYFIQLGRRLRPQRVHLCRKAFFKKKKSCCLERQKEVPFAGVCWVEEEESVKLKGEGACSSGSTALCSSCLGIAAGETSNGSWGTQR